MVFPAPMEQKLSPRLLEKPPASVKKPTKQQELPSPLLEKPSQVPKFGTSDGFATYALATKTIAAARKTITPWFFAQQTRAFTET